MAVFHGKQGLLAFSGINADQDALVASFKINATADTSEASAMDASTGATKHWKDFTRGFKDWNAATKS